MDQHDEDYDIMTAHLNEKKRSSSARTEEKEEDNDGDGWVDLPFHLINSSIAEKEDDNNFGK